MAEVTPKKSDVDLNEVLPENTEVVEPILAENKDRFV